MLMWKNTYYVFTWVIILSLPDKVRKYIELNQMVSAGDKVLVAVSGGPDSVALLHILNSLKKELKISLCAAHLDHMLRGEESRDDARFVKELCERWEIPCTTTEIDVNEYRKRHGLSTELAAREVRYRFLTETAEQYQANRIALGHHADDQAETVLLNVLRGAGPRGVAGMPPVRDEIYIRPLLAIRRRQIERYCADHKLLYRVDSSNQKTIYQRNKIRMHLIPLLEKEYNPEIVLGLGRLANLLREEDSYLDEQTENALAELTISADEQQITIDQSIFVNLPIVLKRRVIRKVWSKLLSRSKDLAFEHVSAIIYKTNQISPAVIELPGGINCQIAYSKIKFYFRNNQQEISDYQYPVKLPGVTKLDELGLVLTARIYQADRFKADPAKLPANEAVFDLEKTGSTLTVRKRKQGDTFNPIGAGGKVKLKKFLIDQKIPKEKRDFIPLICKNNQIIWVGGLRVGEYWKVTEQTKVLLHLKLEKINHNKLLQPQSSETNK